MKTGNDIHCRHQLIETQVYEHVVSHGYSFRYKLGLNGELTSLDSGRVVMPDDKPEDRMTGAYGFNVELPRPSRCDECGMWAIG